MTHADRSTSLVLPAILERVRPLLPADHRVFLVGGTVRDAILGRAAHDLDFVVLQGDALRLAKRVADRLQQSYYPLDVERCTGRVVVEEPSGPLMLDFALARGSDLTADLLARDFTVNALALPPEGRVIADVIDPTGGLQDLALKQIRAVGPGALLADPVRCLRAVRQAHELGFSLEMGTVTLVQQAVPRVGQVSAERLRDELVKILGLVAPVPAIHMLQALGLLAPMLPEVAALPAGAWEHTRRTIEGLFVLDDLEEVRPDLAEHLSLVETGGRDRRTLLALAALLHKLEMPAAEEAGTGAVHQQTPASTTGQQPVESQTTAATAERLRWLRLSGAEVSRVCGIVAGQDIPAHYIPVSEAQHGRDGSGQALLTARMIHRYYRGLGTYGPEVALLSLASLRAGQPDRTTLDTRLAVVRILLDAYFHRRQELIAPPPLVSGHDLMQALGLPPGPRIGILLSEIREAQAAGEVRSQAEALQLALQVLQGPAISSMG